MKTYDCFAPRSVDRNVLGEVNGFENRRPKYSNILENADFISQRLNGSLSSY